MKSDGVFKLNYTLKAEGTQVLEHKKEWYPIATVKSHRLNEQGCINRASLFADSQNMLNALENAYRKLQDMTTEEWQTGCDKPVRDEIREILKRHHQVEFDGDQII